MDYIQKTRPLYRKIYRGGNRGYWEIPDETLKDYAAGLGLDYVTNDDSTRRPLDAPSVLVNYFYHEQIKKSAGKVGENHAGSGNRQTGA